MSSKNDIKQCVMANFNKLSKLLFAVLLSFTLNTQAGWIDDWAASSTRSGPNYFEGQKRGYFNAGSYQARYRNTTENVFSLQKPRLKSGCGGVDLFMGGFSFMDPEYLMQKLQRAMQAAPAIAFDLALKEIMPEVSATLATFEGIINKLNSLQLSECGIAKGVANAMMGDFDLASSGFNEVTSLFDSEASINNSSSKNTVNSQELQKNNDNKPTQEQKEGVEGCSTEFKNVFAKDGSVLEHIAENRGMEAYAGFMRAYLGDVIIKYTDKQYTNKRINKCPDVNVVDVEGIIDGNAQIRPIVGDCANGGDKSLELIVEENLTAITNKIKNRIAFNAIEENFLNSVPFDNLNTIKQHIARGSENYYINQFKNLIAREMAFAMVDDIVDKIAELQEVAKIQAETANTGASAATCNIALVAPIIKSVSDLGKKAREMQKAVRLKRKEIREAIVNYNRIKDIIKQTPANR